MTYSTAKILRFDAVSDAVIVSELQKALENVRGKIIKINRNKNKSVFRRKRKTLMRKTHRKIAAGFRFVIEIKYMYLLGILANATNNFIYYTKTRDPV